ncbi:hypothetical protein BDR04DRAFT_1130754 [Suillus decipiens]|nr:hypothetical protein BDR04DRAFT_1130754 [Suillus decipiens]
MEADDAGLYRVYITCLTILPDRNTLGAVTDAPMLAGDDQIPKMQITEGLSSKGTKELFKVFSNPTSGLLMAYHYSGTEVKNMDVYLQDKANPFCEEYGWHKSAVKIRLPKEGTKWPSETDAPELEIPGSIFMDNVATTFNMIPYCEYWQCSPDCSIEVFSEAYSSPEMLETYDEINALPCEAGDEYERAIASLMLWSDVTHLANFGDASLWPFYLYFRNQSKYLLDDLQDQYMKIFGEPCSTDYPEKVILSGIKSLGQCPCPRCLTKKTEIPLMGTKHDMKHRIRHMRKDDGKHHREVEDAHRLIFQLGVPVDGSCIKNILNDESLVLTRNSFSEKLCPHGFNRFRMFCAIPVFEDLLPKEHNAVVLDLLFNLATWHGFAKLCLHTKDTLNFFDTATVVLGQMICKFIQTTCKYYYTTELPHEYASCGRWEAVLASKHIDSDPKGHGNRVTSGPKHKKLNLNTYKYHALGDYPDTIRQFSTTDSVSTQPGELQHRCIKCWYPKTPKGKKNTVSSMTRIETRERLLGKIVKARTALIYPGSQRYHYHISKYAKTSYDLTEWLGDLLDDIAIVDFILHLKDHLLARIHGIDVLRINYTTYDLQREQDSLNPHTCADIMIIQIFHVDIWDYNTSTAKPCQMNLLFVHWFGRDPSYNFGFSAKQLPHISFLRGDDPCTFGFVDPDVVIQGFEHGQTNEFLPESFVQREVDLGKDWLYFYVNMFVDRDMFMRYRGGEEEGDEDLEIDNEEQGEDEEREGEEEGEREGEGRGRMKRIIEADEGEELDNDILATEGYGAL